MKRIIYIIIMSAFTVLFRVPNLMAQDTISTLSEQKFKHAIELSPLSPVFKIYAIQYAYSFDEKNIGVIGFAYSHLVDNAQTKKYPDWMKYILTQNKRTKDYGVSNAYTLFFGYRRYIWNRFNLEYQLWPAYNSYYSYQEKKYYNGFDLWNELRSGYTVNLQLAKQSTYINLQYLFGMGLVRGYKPDDFGKEGDRIVHYPLFFIGWRF